MPCPLPTTGNNCEQSYASQISGYVYFHSTYIAIVFAVFVCHYVRNHVLVRSSYEVFKHPTLVKAFKHLWRKYRRVALLRSFGVLGSLALLVRSVDPFGWQRMYPMVVIGQLYNITTACIYSMFILYVKHIVETQSYMGSMKEDKVVSAEGLKFSKTLQKIHFFTAAHLIVWGPLSVLSVLQYTVYPMYAFHASKLFGGAAVLFVLFSAATYFGSHIVADLKKTHDDNRSSFTCTSKTMYSTTDAVVEMEPLDPSSAEDLVPVPSQPPPLPPMNDANDDFNGQTIVEIEEQSEDDDEEKQVDEAEEEQAEDDTPSTGVLPHHQHTSSMIDITAVDLGVGLGDSVQPRTDSVDSVSQAGNYLSVAGLTSRDRIRTGSGHSTATTVFDEDRSRGSTRASVESNLSRAGGMPIPQTAGTLPVPQAQKTSPAKRIATASPAKTTIAALPTAPVKRATTVLPPAKKAKRTLPPRAATKPGLPVTTPRVKPTKGHEELQSTVWYTSLLGICCAVAQVCLGVLSVKSGYTMGDPGTPPTSIWNLLVEGVFDFVQVLALLIALFRVKTPDIKK